MNLSDPRYRYKRVLIERQDFVVDGGMTKAYVTPEGPALPAPKNNALQSTPVDTLPGTDI